MTRRCVECGEKFTSPYGRQITCEKNACRANHQAKKSREYYKKQMKDKSETCYRCGKPIINSRAEYGGKVFHVICKKFEMGSERKQPVGLDLSNIGRPPLRTVRYKGMSLEAGIFADICRGKA